MATKKSKRKNAERTSRKTGQYTLQHKVKCDKCEYEFYPTVKELAFSHNTMVIVTGFICKKCGEEYIISVTDNELRKNMSFASDLEKEITTYKRHIKHEINEAIRLRGYVPQDIKNRLNKHLADLENRYNALIKTNTERGKMLKEQYLNR